MARWYVATLTKQIKIKAANREDAIAKAKQHWPLEDYQDDGIWLGVDEAYARRVDYIGGRGEPASNQYKF